MICENCKCEHEGSYGSGRFCSDKCARGFSTKNKREEISEKISLSLTGKNNETLHRTKEYQLRICPGCGNEFKTRIKKRKVCSRKCHRQYFTVETRKKISDAAKQRAIEGTHNGFPSRLNRKPSWAEQYFINCFQRDKIEFAREYKINRFFADFAFVDKMVVLEIDGKQHKEEDRKRRDDIKDSLLNLAGWTVYRIPWKHKDYEEMNLRYTEFIDVLNKK